MKHMVTLAVTLTIAVVALVSLATAEVPQMINYQGRLTDSATGDPYDGNATMIFSIWDDSSGGAKLWEETHPIVAVSQGLFNVLLGSIDSIPDTVFAQPNSWLDIVANGNQMEPRTQIVSVGYAYHARRSETADYTYEVAPTSIDSSHVVDGSLYAGDLGDEPGIASVASVLSTA